MRQRHTFRYVYYTIFRPKSKAIWACFCDLILGRPRITPLKASVRREREKLDKFIGFCKRRRAPPPPSVQKEPPAQTKSARPTEQNALPDRAKCAAARRITRGRAAHNARAGRAYWERKEKRRRNNGKDERMRVVRRALRRGARLCVRGLRAHLLRRVRAARRRALPPLLRTAAAPQLNAPRRAYLPRAAPDTTNAPHSRPARPAPRLPRRKAPARPARARGGKRRAKALRRMPEGGCCLQSFP